MEAQNLDVSLLYLYFVFASIQNSVYCILSSDCPVKKPQDHKRVRDRSYTSEDSLLSSFLFLHWNFYSENIKKFMFFLRTQAQEHQIRSFTSLDQEVHTQQILKLTYKPYIDGRHSSLLSGKCPRLLKLMPVCARIYSPTLTPCQRQVARSPGEAEQNLVFKSNLYPYSLNSYNHALGGTFSILGRKYKRCSRNWGKFGLIKISAPFCHFTSWALRQKIPSGHL